MKIFLDSNVWLRYLVADEVRAFEICRQLLDLIESGKTRPYTSSIVLLEIHYVLGKIYQVPEQQVISSLKDILKTRNLVLIEETNFNQALELHQKHKIKLADSLIATQLPPRATLCTWDKEFTKIPSLKVLTPNQVLAQINR